jgi:hypothetical protein
VKSIVARVSPPAAQASKPFERKIFSSNLSRFLLPKAKKLAEFFLGQASVQDLNL